MKKRHGKNSLEQGKSLNKMRDQKPANLEEKLLPVNIKTEKIDDEKEDSCLKINKIIKSEVSSKFCEANNKGTLSSSNAETILDKKYFFCCISECKKEFNTEYNLSKHYYTKQHRQCEFLKYCDECKQGFENEDTLLKHQKNHPTKCEPCNKTFNNINYKIHSENHGIFEMMNSFTKKDKKWINRLLGVKDDDHFHYSEEMQEICRKYYKLQSLECGNLNFF